MAQMNIPVPPVTPPAVNPPPITPPPVPISIVDSTKNGVNVAQSGTTLTITDKGVVPPPVEIGIGSRVAAVGQVNVRSTAGGTLAGTQPNGALGTVAAGPQTANSFPWWEVTFDTGVSGWVGADGLELAVNPPSPLVAFPGAQGSGAASVGGRGGSVIEVTTLADGGAGSLRAALAASGPRTIVFRVAGCITSLSRLPVANPFVTIAGQTSPGGIVLGGANQSGEQLFISTHDVIARYLSYDGNNPNTPTGPDTGTVGFELASGNVYNVILDHLSAFHWGNKVIPTLSNASGNNVHDITVQWCLFYEPNAAHPVVIELDATAGSALLSVNQDFHHNVAINWDHRFGLFDIRSSRWVNNIGFNWNQFACLSWGGFQGDYIGNKYVDGNLSQDTVHVFLANGNNADPNDPSDNCQGGNPCDNPGPPSFYLLNNTGRAGNTPNGPMVTPTSVANDAGQVSMTAQGWEGGETGNPNSEGPWPASWFRATPLPAAVAPIVADLVQALDAVLLPTVGNSQILNAQGQWVNTRIAGDARVIAQYQARGPGQLFNGQYPAPVITQGTPYPSQWHNGLSDVWVQANGLDTSDANLNNKVMPSGMTVLECFLAGMPPA
jgi:hypothetical protein